MQSIGGMEPFPWSPICGDENSGYQACSAASWFVRFCPIKPVLCIT